MPTSVAPSTCQVSYAAGRSCRHESRTAFSPWRTFVPRYWLPTIDAGIDGGYRVGAMTSGVDVIGRHAITATVEMPTNNTRRSSATSPTSTRASAFRSFKSTRSQDWQSLGGIFARNAARTVSASSFGARGTRDALATWLRQRVRTSLSVTGGVGLEHRTHAARRTDCSRASTRPAQLGAVDYPDSDRRRRFANYQRPPFSISPEDGVQLNVTVRDRLQSGPTGDEGHEL